jgi:hypothetical protein
MTDQARVFTGRITKGKLHVRGWKALRMKDGEVFITIERARAIRSLEANALYWAGYVHPLADYTGYTPKEIHAYLKKRFLPKQRIEIVDKKTGVVLDEQDLDQLTTTTLTSTEFSAYLHEIAEFAETLDVRVGSNRVAA